MEELVTYQGRKYRQVQRFPQVGELVIITNDFVSHGYPVGSVQKVYEVLEKALADSVVKPQYTRDEIVEMVKQDVKKIVDDLYGDKENQAYEPYRTPGHMRVKFRVDHEKRTVTALIYLRYVPGDPVFTGIANCAPDDTFNSHIGRAISLRRALKLDVPEYFLKAPQPKIADAKIGDIVKNTVHGYIGKLAKRLPDRDGEFQGKAFEYDDGDWDGMNERFKIIDDSRE